MTGFHIFFDKCKQTEHTTSRDKVARDFVVVILL